MLKEHTSLRVQCYVLQSVFFVTDPVLLRLLRAVRDRERCLLVHCKFAWQCAERCDYRRLLLKSCYCFYYDCCPVWRIWYLNYGAEAHVLNKLSLLILGYDLSIQICICISKMYKIMKHRYNARKYSWITLFAAQRTGMNCKGVCVTLSFSKPLSNVPVPCPRAAKRRFASLRGALRSSPRSGLLPALAEPQSLWYKKAPRGGPRCVSLIQQQQKEGSCPGLRRGNPGLV